MMEHEALRTPYGAALVGLFGLLLCLAGYAFLRGLARFYAAVLLGILGALAGGLTQVPVLVPALGAAGFVVGFLVGPVMITLNIAFTGAAAGAAIGWVAGTVIGHPGLCAIVAGIALGFLAVLLERPVLIAATSAIGGFACAAAVVAAAQIAGVLSERPPPLIGLGLVLLITGAGVAVQYMTTDRVQTRFRPRRNFPTLTPGDADWRG